MEDFGNAVTGAWVKRLAAEAGFELAGIAACGPMADFERFRMWVDAGMAGEMRYLTDHRADVRADPRLVLPEARSALCVGKLYNGPEAYSTAFASTELGWISRYAWGDDYHTWLRAGLERVASAIRREAGPDVRTRACVDTAPVLERSLAREAGLGWIGKNTCLINQMAGSWFFLGELLLSLELEADTAPPDRCGSCTRCIDACPTAAIVPFGTGWTVDSRLCISYLTIELRGNIEVTLRERVGHHIFGCDICQDVCPWNRKAPVTLEPEFQPRHSAPPLGRMAELSEDEFRDMFRTTPVSRAKYEGFLRNVAVAMGNSGNPVFQVHLKRLSEHPSPVVAEHARWALVRLQ